MVDFTFLCAEPLLSLVVRGTNGAEREISLEKDACEPLGLSFATGLMSGMRSCRNRCVFCFIDQMPGGVRDSLHVKDDDWRMSFIMGNYITLTNVDETEFCRMIARRVSPLYISLHASDPAVRTQMMQNRSAGEVMERLRRLKDAGLCFHLQIVLCPGLNDGAVLERTMRDVERFLPAALSLAIVPVGLTKHREGLFPLTANTPDDAKRLIVMIGPMQEAFYQRFDTRFVFLADEWYILAGSPLPAFEEYETFPQLENGVGLLRLFERDFREALGTRTKRRRPIALTMAGGESACAFFAWMPPLLSSYGIALSIAAVRNDYFGGGVNVGGLITGGDLVAQLQGRLDTNALFIPGAMLRAGETVFLDGMTLAAAQKTLGVRIYPIRGGAHMVELLFRRKL